MREVITNVYTFDELNDNSRTKAIENCKYINVDMGSNWWEWVYEDAKEAGIILNGFDHGFYLDNFEIENYEETAKYIIENWGESPEVSQAEQLLKGLEQADDDERERLTDTYHEVLALYYKNTLLDLYYCLTSEEGIKETILNNGFEFTFSGELYL